jgi:hypothetical protein
VWDFIHMWSVDIQISLKGDTTWLKRWIDGVFIEGSLCSYLSWNEKKKNMKKKFEHERNDRWKKIVCFVHGSIGNKVNYW